MASTTRITKEYVEVVAFAAASQTRVSKEYIEVVAGPDVPLPPEPEPGPPASTATPDPTGERLGCGDYRVFLQLSGGGTKLAELAYESLTFSRRLDDMSEASITLSAAQDADCLPFLTSIEPFAYEVSIWRDDVEVWVGPVSEPAYDYDGMTLAARDLFWWLERRVLPTDRFLTDDIATIAAIFFTDAIDQDPSPNISIIVSPTGIVASRQVYGVLRRRAADEIRELSRTGLDFTAIARTLRLGGVEVGTDPLVLLSDDVFEVDVARFDGAATATEVFVLGASAGTVTPVGGQAGGIGAQGLVQQVYSEPAILDTTSATAAAETRRDLLRTAPLFCSGRLLESAPVAFQRLIPGARVEIRQQVGFRRIEASMRLLEVNVSAQAQDDGFSEEVRLTLEPEGSTQA